MNGAKALAPPNTIRIPNSNNMIITGASHHFFLATINFQMSLISSILTLVWQIQITH